MDKICNNGDCERNDLECCGDIGVRSIVFEQFPDALFVFNKKKQVIDVNSAACEMFGFEVRGVSGKFCNELFACECGGHHCPLDGVIKDSFERRGSEHTFLSKEGVASRYYLEVNPLKGINNEIIGGIVSSRRVDDMEGLNRELLEQTMTDPLTGIGNRRKLYETMEIEISRAVRHRRPFSILMIDIDRFKDYNDAFGHPAGDVALKFIAGLLSKKIRKEDLAARFGGEEFVVLLPETDAEGAVKQAERLRRLVDENTASEDSLKTALKISVGAATCDSFESCRASSLISYADKALYNAKRTGRNKVVHFNNI